MYNVTQNERNIHIFEIKITVKLGQMKIAHLREFDLRLTLDYINIIFNISVKC